MAKRRSNATILDLDWKAIHRVADAKVATVRRILVRALDEARDSVTDEELAAPWLYSPEGMRRAVDWQRVAGIIGSPEGSYAVYKAETAADVFGSLYLDGGTIAGGAFGGRLDLTVPEAIRYGETRAGALITGIQTQQVEIVRDHLGSALRDGIEPARLGRILRSTTGLSPRQARSLENYERGLYEKYLTGRTSIPLRGLGRPLADQRFSLTRLDEERIGILVDRYRERLVNYRAEMIARTETMRAANMGAFDEWRAAGDAGLFDVRSAQRIWIATPDDRACDDCLSLDGEVIGFEETFTVPGEETDDEESSLSADMPPLHPMCRCSTALEIGEDSMNEAFRSGEFDDLDTVDDLDPVPPDDAPTPEPDPVPEIEPEDVPETLPIPDVDPEITTPIGIPDDLPTISPFGSAGIDPRDVVEYATRAAEKRYGPIVDELSKIHGVDPGMPRAYQTKFDSAVEMLRARSAGIDPNAAELRTVIVKGGKTKNLGGSFRPAGKKTGTRRAGNVDVDTRPRITANVSEGWGPTSDLSSFVHEFGHRVDAVYGGPGATARQQYRYAVENMARDGVDEAVRFVQVVADSEGMAAGLEYIRGLGVQGYEFRQYFVSTREVWARAYNQWAAYRLRDTLPEVYESFLEVTRRTPWYQWSEQEFTSTIGPAVEAVLRARGLMT